jgi:glycosyltransferase involved in cell wall biosynthesis
MAPLVSVVIPTWNRAAYLREALESVFKQTFEDYEIIVVDDTSTDSTPEVVRDFGERVHFVRQEHQQGPGAARNRGVEEAQGRYVAFLDSDDLWLPEKLAAQVAELELRAGAIAVACNSEIIGHDGVLRLRCSAALDDRDVFDAETIFRQNPIQTSVMVVRKESFIKSGGFDEAVALVGVEDLDLWLRLAVLGPIRYIPRVLARYRSHKDSLSGKKKLLQEKTITDVLERFLRTHPELCRAWRLWVHKLMFQVYYELLIYPFLLEGDLPAVREGIGRARAHRPWHPKTYIHESLLTTPARVRRRWQKVVSASLFAKHFQLQAYECLLRGNMRKAHTYARRAIHAYPLHLKSYAYWLFTFFPPSAYAAARRVKKTLWP